MAHRSDTLAQRLRALADELESAERYGVPLPEVISATGYLFGGASFHLGDPDEFDAWADYTEAEVREYDLDDEHWRSARVDVNGLTVEFATSEPIAVSA